MITRTMISKREQQETISREADDYEIYNKIGNGKYSEVFQGYNILNNQSVVLKVLKPNQLKKLLREVLILRNLDHENIIKLLDVVQDNGSGRYTLVFEQVDHIPLRQNYQLLTVPRIKFIMKSILLALDHAHSRGIFHRDIKPQNLLTNKDFSYLKVIDWGLGEFYHEYQEYNVRVASRYFKAPELLLDHRVYHHSLDSWSLGCVLAGMIFQKEPFFYGQSNDDMLYQIIQVLGNQSLEQYLISEDIKIPLRYNIQPSTRKKWDYFINESNEHLCTPDALDLLDKLLTLNHQDRILPKEALQHKFIN